MRIASSGTGSERAPGASGAERERPASPRPRERGGIDPRDLPAPVPGGIDDRGQPRRRDSRQRDAPRVEYLLGDFELVQLPGRPGRDTAPDLMGEPGPIRRGVERLGGDGAPQNA